MEKKTVLIISNDRDSIKDLRTLLLSYEFKVMHTLDLQEGYDYCIKSLIDIILLDFTTNLTPAFELITNFRKVNNSVPIIFISNRNDIESKVIAFNSGCNDYIVKPYNNYELLVRINNQLRTFRKETGHIFQNAELRIDFDKKTVYVSDNEIHLTNIEYKILVLLATNLDKTLTYDYIIKNIWGDGGQDQNGLRVFISAIRRKLGATRKVSKLIRTQVNVGYRMKKFEE